jgi:3-oxoacyl-[acyl-carrier protein] reductase
MRKLENKIALITGCNRGIGKAIMQLFVEEGASIIACTRKETPELSEDYHKLKLQYGVEIFPLYFDLNNDDEIKAAMKQVYSWKINVDILVNNAGIASWNPLAMTRIDDIKKSFQVNYFAPVLITQYISKLMSKNKQGIIINMCSVAGMDNSIGNTVYGASKASLILFTKTLAQELACFNVRVNGIAPGIITTEMGNSLNDKISNDMIEHSALKRKGLLEEIAKTALFLVTDDSSYIIGQIIRVDGGMQ